jgi:hypothetical protein
MAVEFVDNSIVVKTALNDKTKAWVIEWAKEIASTAKDNCALDGEEGNQLRASYRADVNGAGSEAKVGTPLESGYWEEFGTGEHAVSEPHRSGWWVYIEGGSGYEGETNYYKTKEEAESMAAYIRRKYDKPAVATNGRDPNYTLEKAFIVNKPKAIADLERKLKEL